MARAKSPEKRQAILDAAVREIALSGLGAATAGIARGAGLAEGTLFTYFASKDVLLNELYLELKRKAYEYVNADFPLKASLRERARHVWTRYLEWAMRFPEERKVSLLLHLSEQVSAATRLSLTADCSLIMQTLAQVGGQGVFKAMPPQFAASAMTALQDAVLEAAAGRRRGREAIVADGFEAFWRMAR